MIRKAVIPAAALGTRFLPVVERLIRELQAQQDILNKNRKNSSKPPSSDGFKKPCTKSTRKSGSKKAAGRRDIKVILWNRRKTQTT